MEVILLFTGKALVKPFGMQGLKLTECDKLLESPDALPWA